VYSNKTKYVVVFQLFQLVLLYCIAHVRAPLVINFYVVFARLTDCFCDDLVSYLFEYLCFGLLLFD